ncbi:MAG: hypothetical protein ACXADU_04780 [Promethearchaeota archaeon]|jgi:hypothetical protein
MTTLVEKALLLGFSIFALIVFSSILIPFFQEINDFNNNRDELDSYFEFIDEIDLAVLYIIDDPNQVYLKVIEYPKNFNITINDCYINYQFIFEENTISKVSIHNSSFLTKIFQNIPPQTYLLNVSYQHTLIFVNIINLN